MSENFWGLIALCICIIAWVWERHHRRSLEKKIEHMVDAIVRFQEKEELTLEPILEEGQVANLQNQLVALEEQIFHRLEYGKDREKRLNQFMENMAHQMKTSLTALQIRVDLAQVKATTTAEITELEECQKCLTRLSGEVERILECSQLADKKINMKLQQCDVKQLIYQSIKVLKPIQKKKKVELNLNISDIEEIYLDTYWFSQAIENIIKNAIEHTKVQTTVEIAAREQGSCLMIEIKDAGDGIDEAELPYIFERFHRGNAIKSGYGIGLSMAKDIIEAHHGTIFVENRSQGGACFQIELPILNGRKPYENVRDDVSNL